ncbi:MAG: hypothetical protein ABIG88_01360 [Patescibacteria group bacterium]|nr:hypothetical protein [Patescibacteria group bacterium]
MPKKIKESEGFIVGWNRKREKTNDLIFFIRHKNIDNYKVAKKKPWDVASYLVNKAKEIDKKKKK